MRDQHNEVVRMWKDRESRNFVYFDQVESLTNTFWGDGSLFRQLFDKIDSSELLEIACGQGRHTARVPIGYKRIFALDTSTDAVANAKERFRDNQKITVAFSEDGVTIPQPDNSFTGAFSYDAMVHFEPLTMASYLRETERVLKPGGRALFHHSVYDKNPTGAFTESQDWRNYMTPDLFAHFASRAGLMVLESHSFAWGNPEIITDGLTLLEKQAN